MRGIRRLTLVSVLAVVAFAVALANFRDVPASECLMGGVDDASVHVEFLAPLSVDASSHALRVTRNGMPVADAQVCLRAEAEGMSGMGVSDLAQETEPGLYDLPVRFDRRGIWNATVVIARGAEEAVRVAFPVNVR